MAALSKILRSIEGGRVGFWCPGCKRMHVVTVGDGPGPRWGYNGNPERPTFTPSVLVRSGHHAPGHKPGDACWCTYNAEHPDEPDPFQCQRCHSWVTDGCIQFLGDSTHALAGKTVPLPPLPDYMRD